jgi:PAS domain S-box-containing protein
LVENTGDSIWSVDRDHRLITLNSAFSLAVEARTNHEPRAGMLPSELFPGEEDAQWHRELYTRTLAGERHVAVRSEVVDGQLRYSELYANPIHSLEGVIGAVFFGKDVTQRVRAEEALQIAKDEAEAANKAKSDFLANMSHELRTPLNSVIGFTNILLKNKDERLNEKDLGFLTRVLANGKHLLALINEVLDLAKVEAGRMELIIEEVDLAHLCVETVQQLEGQAKAKEGAIQLVADVPAEVALVETDSAKLKQVIINLVGNALKFTEKGSVTVRLDMAADGRTPIAISVSDTGIGIPEDRLGAIFEAFQQAEAGTSRKYGGTGLGLALSRSICLLMGYDLIVESVLGVGSTFKIVMGQRAERPVKPQHPDDDEAVSSARPAPTISAGADGSAESAAEPWRFGTRPPADAPGAGPAQVGEGDSVVPAANETAAGAVPRPGWADFKVLVIDDEADSRLLVSHTLADFGCQVFVASNGEDGLRLAREHQPDLVTLDLMMPGLTGWEVLERLKADESLRPIPVVIVSVVANEGRGRLVGAVDMITKPFEREDLLRVLWRNLGRRRGGRVLLMVGNDEQRLRLADVVRERGLEVAEAKGTHFVGALGRESPDAVVLDMAMPGLHGVAALLELREDRVHTGLPVLVVNRDDLNEKEREIIRELATMRSEPADAPEKLAHLLDASFPHVGEEDHGAGE